MNILGPIDLLSGPIDLLLGPIDLTRTHKSKCHSVFFTRNYIKLLHEGLFFELFFCLVQAEFAHSSRRYAPEWLVERERERERERALLLWRKKGGETRSLATLNLGALGLGFRV